MSGWTLRLQRGLQGLIDLAYAAWAHALFWSLAPLAWLLVVVTPGIGLRWQIAGSAARVLLRLGGVGPTVTGFDQLPRTRPCIVVCNHASYLDGVVMIAALPFPVRVIAKAELASQVVAATFLPRIGAAFVDRFEALSGAEDARRASALLETGGRDWAAAMRLRAKARQAMLDVLDEPGLGG